MRESETCLFVDTQLRKKKGVFPMAQGPGDDDTMHASRRALRTHPIPLAPRRPLGCSAIVRRRSSPGAHRGGILPVSQSQRMRGAGLRAVLRHVIASAGRLAHGRGALREVAQIRSLALNLLHLAEKESTASIFVSG